MAKAKIKQWKKDEVDEFSELIDDAKIVGVVNLQNMPARQLQNMREKLRDQLTLKMTKVTLIKRAFEKSDKKNLEELEPHLRGMPALLFTKENPFALYSLLKKEKSKAPIKGGQEAPKDIVIPAGPTDFPPGPIIGQLGSMGIPTGVEAGKVAVQKDTTVAEKGEVVDNELAGILGRLGIEPMEIGLNLVAVHENGEVLTEEVLDIDEEAYAQNFKTAAAEAFNLAFNAGFPTQDNIKLMLSKASSDALALAKSEDILTDETVKDILSKAEGEAKALGSGLDLSADVEEKAEEKDEQEASGEAASEEDDSEKKEDSKEDKDDKESEKDSEDDDSEKDGSDDEEAPKDDSDEKKGDDEESPADEGSSEGEKDKKESDDSKEESKDSSSQSSKEDNDSSQDESEGSSDDQKTEG